MKASELIKRIQALIDKEGDKDICIAGVFTRGVHRDFGVFSPSDYYDKEAMEGTFFGTMIAADVDDSFVIDEK